jgi:hypothetical protein
VAFFSDEDGDGFAPASALQANTMFCADNAFTPARFTRRRPSTTNRSVTDCLDSNAAVFPGQPLSFDQPAAGLNPPFDYNCDGVEVATSDPSRNVERGNCASFSSDFSICLESGAGWVPRGEPGGGIPACGQMGTFQQCLSDGNVCGNGRTIPMVRSPCQ